MAATKDPRNEAVDLREVERLVEALERDLARIPAESPDVQRLKDEVQTLKNVLHSPVRRQHWIRDALHGTREGLENALDTVVAQGIKGSRYVAEIGRILGL